MRQRKLSDIKTKSWRWWSIWFPQHEPFHHLDFFNSISGSYKETPNHLFDLSNSISRPYNETPNHPLPTPSCLSPPLTSPDRFRDHTMRHLTTPYQHPLTSHLLSYHPYKHHLYFWARFARDIRTPTPPNMTPLIDHPLLFQGTQRKS